MYFCDFCDFEWNININNQAGFPYLFYDIIVSFSNFGKYFPFNIDIVNMEIYFC